MPETTPLIKAALNLRVGAGFDVYELLEICQKWTQKKQQIFFGFTASCAAAVRRDGYSVEIKEDGGTLVYRLFTNY